ncbi:MAG: phage major capsid protein [bacterium]
MLNLDDVNATVREKFIPVAVDNVFEDILLFYRLVKRNKLIFDAPGKDGYITQPIIADKYPVYAHDNKYGRLQVPTQEILTTAKFKFATRYGSVPLTREDDNVLTSKEAVIDTLKVRYEVMINSLIDTIESQLFVQTAVSEGEEIDSIGKIVDNGDNYSSYAGINRVDFSNWKSYVKNNAGAAITYADLSNVKQKATIGREKPTIVFTTEELWTKINQIIFDKFHYYPPADKEVLDLGIDNYLIFGAPCVANKNVPSGQIIFLNENYLYLALKKDADEKGMTFVPYERVDLMTIKASHLFWDGQLYCPAPRLQTRIINAV